MPSFTQVANAETTPQLVDTAAHYFQNRPFIEDDGVTLSFSEFRDYCRAAAAALISNGFKPKQRAAIWAPNMYQWVIAALAVQYAGGVLITVNTRYKGSEAADILINGKASVLFCMGEFLGDYYPDKLNHNTLGALDEVVVFGKRDGAAHTDWKAFIDRGRAYIAEQGESEIDARANAVKGDDTSDILFTSGTTGSPKGVLTNHRQNLQTFALWTEILGLNDSDRYLIINPFFHSFGYKAGILACLLRGATLLPHKVFDTESVLRRIEEEKVSVMPGPPTLFQSILSYPQRTQFDLSSLKKATTGAAVISVELIERMRKDLGIDTVITAYGLSECSGLATMCRRDDSAETIAHTSGRPLPGVEVRCIDSHGDRVPTGSPGEILVRGFNVMSGYLDNPEATAESIDSEGWLHTGDVGILDSEGNLAITDRIKDMFICGGFNCYPAEIENQLCTHPAIDQAAVIGVPDERMGEVSMAWVVSRSPTLGEEALINWCRENMANYKVPRYLRFVDNLPTNASGKILKTELRKMHEQDGLVC